MTIVCSDNSHNRLPLQRETSYSSAVFRPYPPPAPARSQDVTGDAGGRGGVSPNLYKPRRARPAQPEPGHDPEARRSAELPRVEAGSGNGSTTRVKQSPFNLSEIACDRLRVESGWGRQHSRTLRVSPYAQFFPFCARLNQAPCPCRICRPVATTRLAGKSKTKLLRIHLCRQ